MKIWTYERIDLSLVRDDPDSVVDISPRTAWRTREAAKAAADLAHKEEFDEWATEEANQKFAGSDLVDYEPLVWVEDDDEGLVSQRDDVDGDYWHVFYMELN